MHLLKNIVDLEYDEFESTCWNEFYKHKESCWQYIGNIDLDIPQVELQINPFDSNINLGIQGKNNDYLMARHYFNKEDLIFQSLQKYLEADYMSLTMNVQKSGWLTPVHFDRNRTLCKTIVPNNIYNVLQAKSMKKFVVFLQDQVIGQNFTIGHDSLHWKAGDIIQWEWFAPHYTSNSSTIDRMLLTIPCIKIKNVINTPNIGTRDGQ